jgi:Tfp pilus assembly protein PilX
MDTHNMNPPKFRATGSRADRGISLIIVLIMLVIIGITTATAMRSATSEQRVTNNLRMEGIAQQYAEAALRYCENQVRTPDAARTEAKLKTAVLSNNTSTFANSLWETTTTWAAGSARIIPVPAAQVSDALATAPPILPQCVAELQTMGGGTSTFVMTVITARGFSPDYAADGTGNTIKGAVVWLQSIVNAQ